MELKELCSLAWDLGKDLDLTGCGYGPSHVTANLVLVEPYQYYYFLAGFCKAIDAKNILEIGTHYGGSICSMNRAVEATNIVTIDPSTHNELPSNIKRIQGRGEDKSTYKGLRKLFNGDLDFVFIDGVHSFDNTKAYLENVQTLRPKFVMFDDIHLNEEMDRLWKYVSVRYKSYDCSLESNRDGGCGFGVIQLR